MKMQFAIYYVQNTWNQIVSDKSNKIKIIYRCLNDGNNDNFDINDSVSSCVSTNSTNDNSIANKIY